MTPKSGKPLVEDFSRWVSTHICAGVLREEAMSSENQNWSSAPTELHAENGELNNPMALLVIGPAEQQSAFQNQVKLLLRVLPELHAEKWRTE